MENIQTSDLTAVGELGGVILLFVRNEDVGKEDVESIQYDFGLQEFNIGDLQKFLKFTPFEAIDTADECIQDYYRDQIYRHLPTKTFIESLIDFSPKGESVPLVIKKAILEGLIDPQTVIEKSWKKQDIGTVVTHKDGTQWRKQSETKNQEQDWVQIKKDKEPSEQVENKENKEPKVDGNTIAPHKPEELKIHAQNTSQAALESAVKQSADPKVRQAANEELDRREQEEKPQEEGGKESEEKETEQKEDKEVEEADEKKMVVSLAEAVGANEPFDYKKYKKLIDPYVKEYTTYRYWSDPDMNLSKRQYLSTTSDIKSFDSMIEDGGMWTDGVITKHTGKGFDPYTVILSQINNVPSEDQKFIKDTIQRNKHQKEIFLLDVEKPSKENIIGNYKDGDDSITLNDPEKEDKPIKKSYTQWL